MDGVALCARFSLATSRLQYCGPSDAPPDLYAAVVEGRQRAEARGALEKFEALYPYLAAIGAKHGLDPFDPEVVEAYWIGNRLLDPFDRSDFARILRTLSKRGLPPSVARRLLDHLPGRPTPHHVFHVAFVGVGAVTGHVPTTLENIERCRPGWAEVVERLADRLVVRRRPLVNLHGKLGFGEPVVESIPFDARVVPSAEPGTTVALHWGWPALVLAPDQSVRLRQYTERSIAAANEALPSLAVLPVT